MSADSLRVLTEALRDLLEAVDRSGDVDGVALGEWIDTPDGRPGDKDYYAGGAVTRARAALRATPLEAGVSRSPEPLLPEPQFCRHCDAPVTTSGIYIGDDAVRAGASGGPEGEVPDKGGEPRSS